MVAARCPKFASWAVGTLRNILERSPEAVIDTDLTAIASMRDVEHEEWVGVGSGNISFEVVGTGKRYSTDLRRRLTSKVDCSGIRQLAQQELQRRGERKVAAEARATAVRGLASRTDGLAPVEAMQALNDVATPVRLAAAEVLGLIGDVRAIRLLIRLVASNDVCAQIAGDSIRALLARHPRGVSHEDLMDICRLGAATPAYDLGRKILNGRGIRI
jgi:hypothetical protein